MEFKTSTGKRITLSSEMYDRLAHLTPKFQWEVTWQSSYSTYDTEYINKMLLKIWKEVKCFDHIEPYINDGDKILDIGGGVISILRIINKDCDKYMLDPLADFWDYFAKYKEQGIKSKVGRMEKLPYDDNYFDVVCCTNVLDHIKIPRKGLREMRRVLKEDGISILSIDAFIKKPEIRTAAHPHSFNEDDINNLLKDEWEILYRGVNKGRPSFLNNYILGKKKKPSDDNINEIIYVMKKK